MANPYSTWTRVRFIMARWLDPYPDKGKAWCLDCTLNGGRTLVLNAAGHAAHVLHHRGASGKTPDNIAIRANYGRTPQAEEPG